MRKLTLGMAAVAAAASAPAFAGQTTGSMDVTVNVENSCSLTAAPIDFGTPDITAGATSSSASTLRCTPNAIATVLLSDGFNLSGGSRRMDNVAGAAAGTEFITYALNNAGGAAWNAAGETFTGSGNDDPLGINGVIPAQAAKPAGAYSDTVTITVNY